MQTLAVRPALHSRVPRLPARTSVFQFEGFAVEDGQVEAAVLLVPLDQLAVQPHTDVVACMARNDS